MRGALCQKERARCVFTLNALSSSDSHTHSVCCCVLVGTLQPKQQHFKWVWLIGGAERELTGKLAVQGIRGTLAHTHAFIPLFTLDQPLTALFLSGRLKSAFQRCHLFIVRPLPFPLLLAHFSPLLISLIEYRSFKQSIFQLLSISYLICVSVLMINHSLIHLANYNCQQRQKSSNEMCVHANSSTHLCTIHACTVGILTKSV